MRRDRGVVELRRGSAADGPVIAALHREARAVAMPWLAVVHTPAEDVAFFTGVVLAEQEVWIAERNGDVVGFAARDGSWLEHLYVASSAQGSGVGRLLLERVRFVARDRRPLRLHVFARNVRARRFYEAAGWKLVAQSDGSANEEHEPDCTYQD
jgi:putative acetyltransferase